MLRVRILAHQAIGDQEGLPVIVPGVLGVAEAPGEPEKRPVRDRRARDCFATSSKRATAWSWEPDSAQLSASRTSPLARVRRARPSARRARRRRRAAGGAGGEDERQRDEAPAPHRERAPERRGGDGEREREAAAPALVRLHPDAPPVRLDQASHHGQADTAPAAAAMRLLVGIEDLRHQVRRDSDAGVGHAHEHLALLEGDAHLDASAGRREPHGVREEIHEDLLDPLGVGRDQGKAVRHGDVEAEAAALGERARSPPAPARWRRGCPSAGDRAAAGRRGAARAPRSGRPARGAAGCWTGWSRRAASASASAARGPPCGAGPPTSGSRRGGCGDRGRLP